MNNIIKVDIKTHYGTEHIYVTSEQKEPIKILTGKETLTRRHIEALKQLGFRIDQNGHPITAANIVRRFTAASKE